MDDTQHFPQQNNAKQNAAQEPQDSSGQHSVQHSHLTQHSHVNSLVDFTLSDYHCGVSFERPMDALSSAIYNGGKTRAMGWLNIRVPAEGNHENFSAAAALEPHIKQLGFKGPVVGMMTAASMKSCRMRYFKRTGIHVFCVATTGTANARRIGDTADVEGWHACQWQPGTINIAVITNANLSDAAKVEALQLIAEAKTAACHDTDLLSPVSGFIATGTGTDASAIFCDPEGLPLDFCGKHVLMGEVIGTLVYDVVREGILACQATAERDTRYAADTPTP